MASNPFDVEVVNPLQALLLGQQSYASGIESNKKRAMEAARNEAGQLYAAGDVKGALARLLTGGDLQGAGTYSGLDQNDWTRRHTTERDAVGDKRWAQEFALKKQQAAEGGGVYGTPIYGQDPATGEIVLGAIAKDGKFRRIDTGGVVPTPGGIKPLDTGAGYVPFDPRRGAVVGQTVPKTGEVSKDYRPVPGADGTISAQPIPGSPAAQKIEEEATKSAARADTTASGGRAIKGIISDVRSKVESAPWYDPAAGFGAGLVGAVPGSRSHDTSELLKTITANIGFDRLQRMREESPTGGALGAVAVQELEALQKTVASLAQSQSKGQFLHNLKRVEDQYDKIIRKAEAYPNAAKHGFGKGAQAPAAGVVGWQSYFGQ